MKKTNIFKGWELPKKIELVKPSVFSRLTPEKKAVTGAIWAFLIFLIVFIGSIYLAKSLSSHAEIIKHSWVWERNGAEGRWAIFLVVVILTVFFEFMDASVGMGLATALTPILLIMDFNPLQIVPIIMIQQAVSGLVNAFLHKRYENIEWKFNPLSETTKVSLIIFIAGCTGVLLSITAFYAWLKIEVVWIKAYVAVLLLGLSIFSIIEFKKERIYSVKKMVFFSGLAGINKGVSAGGFGPLITIGSILSGIPAKATIALSALAKGSVSLFGVIIWLALISGGTKVDFILLPSIMLGTMFSAIIAPYADRVLPEKFWKLIVPAYFCIIAVICFWAIAPEIVAFFH